MAPGTFSDVRSLHERGIISIACDKSNSNSEKFITSGTDDTLYVWDSKCISENIGPVTKIVGEATHSCLVWKDSHVYIGYTTTDLITGVDKKVIGKASLDDLESPSQVLSFSLEPTAVDVGSSYLVAGGSDFAVKRLDLATGKYERFDVSGEVLSIKIDPKEEVFALSCTDGSVIIYNLEDVSEVAKIKNAFPGFSSIDVSNPRVLLTWSSDGKELFVPSQGCVKAISRDDWTMSTRSFKGKGTEGDSFSACCISSSGLLCASTMNNKIVVWRISDREIVSSTEYKRIAQGKCTITDICFAPFDQRSIILTDANEGLCTWKNAIPSSLGDGGKTTTNSEEAIDFSDDDMDDNDEENSNSRKKSRNRALFDDEADDNGEEVEEIQEDTKNSFDIGAIKRTYGDNGTGSGRLEDFGFGPRSNENSNMGQAPTDFSSMLPAPVTKVVEYEPPAIPSQFVSGSTPSRLAQRYLKWNSFGVIRCYNNENDSNIEIEFHDANIHSDILLDNTSTNFSMADLSDRAVALASVPEEKKEHGEMLVIHINSWDPESQRWTTKFPLKDGPLDVLVSRELIAVITEQRNIRLFTLAGTQRHIISHPGPILTATMFESKISVASVTGGEYFEEKRGERRSKAQYQFSVCTYDVNSKSWFRQSSNISSVSIPVGPGHKLEWLGYSNEGQLVAMDNSYTVRLLTSGGFWTPIFDGAAEIKEKSDAVWPISVVGGRSKQIRYLYCKGSRYPMVSVKMAPLIAPWSLPFCQPDSEKTQLEEVLMLNELRQSREFSDPDAINLSELTTAHLQSVVKLFALACQSERETRASEFAQFVSSSKGIQVMCNYATKMKKQVLADKVAAIGREQMSATLDDSLFSQASTVTERLAPRRVSLNRRRTVNSVPAVLPEDEEEAKEAEDSPPMETTHDEKEGDLPSEQTHNVSLQLPVQRFNRNPFKRSAADTSVLDTSTGSVFDQLEASFDNPRKRTKEEELKSAPCSQKKQMKLGFGAAPKKGKENSGATAFSLWLEQNEGKMKELFSGEADEFDKFCTGQYRLLSAAEKKEWRSRAESA